MKKLLFLLPLLLLACDKDDTGDTSEIEGITGLNVTGISVNLETQTVSQLDIDTNTEEIVLTNLTQSLGVPVNASKSFSDNDVLNWFQAANGNYQVWQKNIRTGETNTVDAPCEFTDENLQTVNNTLSELLYFTRYFGDVGETSESRLRIFSEGNGCDYLPFESTSILSTYTYGSTLLIQALNIFNPDDVKVIKINTATGSIEGEIAIQPNARMTAIEEQLHAFYPDGDYSIYSLTSFELIETKSIDLISSDLGFFYTTLKDDRMVVDVPYPQPSIILEGPAVANLNTGEIVTPYAVLFTIQENIQQINNSNASVNAYAVDLEKELMVCSFTSTLDSVSHGIAVTNLNGSVLQIMEVDMKISELIIRD